VQRELHDLDFLVYAFLDLVGMNLSGEDCLHVKLIISLVYHTVHREGRVGCVDAVIY
jgi:hypothetical protein